MKWPVLPLLFACATGASLHAGERDIHLSNGNRSEPRKQNIGVDSFGMVAGVGWAF
jgi:hypothetical protein